MIHAVLQQLVASRGRFAADLAEFVRFASVGSDPARRRDVVACARWLARRLQRAGVADARVLPTPGLPIVCGSWRHALGAPTVLVYGHYDVQPAEPIDAWRTPPFELTRHGDELIGRGASDDKGQLLCHVFAIEGHLAATGRLPINVVCLFDGEEEHGSPHLRPFLEERRGRLRPDVAVMSDTRLRDARRPALVVATRGALSARVVLRRAGPDVHSGQFGGAVPDAAASLCRVLSALHDARGRVTIPGFYDGVRRRSPAERRRMAVDAPSDAELLRAAGTPAGAGEAGFTAYERTTARPALTVTGVRAGYAGPGGKAAVPARAEARLNLRLVDDQDPAVVARRLRAHLRALTPDAFNLEITMDSAARPTCSDPRRPPMRAATEALRRAFGRPPALLRSGGTLPVVGHFQDVFGAPTVLMGFARPEDGMHGPNERVSLLNLYRGTAACCWFYELLARGETGAMRRVAA